MGSTSSPLEAPIYRFGPYELRSGIGQLSKHGVRLRLQMKPAQLLEALLEAPGELITRDVLRQRLWPEGTFVDFEGSINTAINRLRAALNDAPEAPRFIETVPRLGYRFIHPVVREAPEQSSLSLTRPLLSQSTGEHPVVATVPQVLELPLEPPPMQHPFRRRLAPVFIGAFAAAICFAAYLLLPLSGRSGAPHFRQLTFHTGSIPSARFLPGLQSVAYTSFLPGGKRESKTIDFAELLMKPVESKGGLLSSVNSRGELTFVSRSADAAMDPAIVTITPEGKQVGEIGRGILAADWSPRNSDLALARHDGALSVVEFPRGRPVFSTPGWVSDLRVSPWGDRVAFLDHPVRDDDGGFVEVVERNGVAHRLTPLWSSASGLAWSASGREIWFSAGRDGSTLALFSVNLSGKLRDVFGSPASIRLLDFAKTGDLLVTVDDTRMSMMAGAISDVSETDISKFDCSHVDAISEDGRFLLFTECGSAVGRHYTAYLRDLTSATTTQVGSGRAMALSADGRQAITIDPQNRTVLTLHDIATGRSRALPSDGIDYQWARFLPGTTELLVGGSRNGMPLAIYKQCPGTGSLDKVAVPAYLDDVVISPSGQMIAGLFEGKLRAFEWQTGRELTIPAPVTFFPLGWSADGRKLYVMNTRTLEISSVEIGSGEVERWRQLPGRDKPGFVAVAGAVAAPEAGVYAYSLHLSSSRLYLVSGLT